MPRHRSLFGITASLTLGLVVASCSRTDGAGSNPAGLGVTPPPTAGASGGGGSAPRAGAGGGAGEGGGSRPALTGGSGGTAGSAAAPASGSGGKGGSEPALAGGSGGSRVSEPAPAGGAGGVAGSEPAPAGGVGGGAGTSPAAAGSTGASGTATASPKDCPADLPGPKLVRLATPGGVSYCMDRTEVTQKQYATFIEAAKADPSVKDNVKGQHPICKYGFELIVQNVEPTEDTPSNCRGSLYNPEKTGDFPVVCMSHCAARAYCQWAGKELCGAPAGGAADLASDALPEKSAWHNACTSGGKQATASAGGVASGKRGGCQRHRPQGRGGGARVSLRRRAIHPNPQPRGRGRGMGGLVRSELLSRERGAAAQCSRRDRGGV